MHQSETSRSHLAALNRKETLYWILSAILLALLSATVILQYVSSDAWLGEDIFTNSYNRQAFSIGLPGLVIIFILYVTAKRREIRRLKATLYNQQALLGRLEEHTEKLESTLSELKRVNTLKDHLLTTVSHELQNPLTSIHAVAQLLMKYDDEETEARDNFHRIIYDESKRLSVLVSNLLDLARIESGRMVWDLSLQDPKEMLRTTIAAAGVTAGEKGIAIREEHDAAADLILVDPNRVAQVMGNLIGNAIKFTPEKGTITIRTVSIKSNKGKAVRFSVRDTGPGIPNDQKEKIFKWFHRIPTSTERKKPGTGLGLAISREIVEHFGGRIWVENAGGEGSEFIFTIPIAELPEEKPGIPSGPGQKDHSVSTVVAEMVKEGLHETRSAAPGE